jgi:2-methylfumaryl-CoA isomerase
MTILAGLRIVEGSAFVAAPLGGLTLAELGADVIRFDAIGGGIDYARWPVTETGRSLYWAGLNKGKRSIAIDVRRPEGQELASALITAPGPEAGIFLSNFPAIGWLGDEQLRARRSDLIYVNITGNPDGSTAVDYTINAASGIALATGEVDATLPTNNCVPAWDIAAGLHAVIAILAAERRRGRTQQGQLVTISLADVAFTMVANLGYLAQAEILHENRPPLGNQLYGAFGRDFATSDQRRVMVVALSVGQWRSLVDATGIAEVLPALEQEYSADFRNEADRYRARDAIAALLKPWFEARPLEEVALTLDKHGVCWGPFQTFTQLFENDWRVSNKNPVFADVIHPGIGSLRTPASPIRMPTAPPIPPAPAPVLGMHTDEILADVLGLSTAEIAALHDRQVVGGPEVIS